MSAKRTFAGRERHGLLLSGLSAAAAPVRRAGRQTFVGLLPGRAEEAESARRKLAGLVSGDAARLSR